MSRVRRVGAAGAALSVALLCVLLTRRSAHPQMAPTPTFDPNAPAPAAPWQVPLRLLVGDDDDWRLQSLRAAALAIRLRTSIDAAQEVERVTPDAASLFTTPLLFWSVQSEVRGGAELRIALSQFFAAGGLLVIDGDPVRDAAFLRDAEQLASSALPDDSLLRPVASDDILLHSFYLLPGPGGYEPGDLRAARVRGHIALLVSHSDLLGGLTPEGTAQRERSTRLLVNITMYALCLDYKDDQVHAPFLMRRRRGAP